MKRAVKPSRAKSFFHLVRPQGVELIRARALEKIPWLVHAFTTRRGPVGELNLGFSARFPPDQVRASRARLRAALRADSMRIVVLRQIHSAIVHAIDGPPAAMRIGDALMTARPSLLLAVQTADCLPILIVDLRERVVAAVHAGWRGTLARIAEKTVGEMRAAFGTKPADLLAAIGPGIHACCYEVGEEVLAEYQSQFSYAGQLFRPAQETPTRAALWTPPLDPIARQLPPPPGHAPLDTSKAFLDLVAANRRQLLEAGVPGRRILAHPDCTACDTRRYFSYRKEGPTGRMMGVIGRRENSRSS